MKLHIFPARTLFGHVKVSIIFRPPALSAPQSSIIRRAQSVLKRGEVYYIGIEALALRKKN